MCRWLEVRGHHLRMEFQDSGDQESPDIEYPGRFITGGLLEARADSYAIFWNSVYICIMACMVRLTVIGPTYSRDEVLVCVTGPTCGRDEVGSR